MSRLLTDLGYLTAGIVGLVSLVVIVPLIGFFDAARTIRAQLAARGETRG